VSNIRGISGYAYAFDLVVVLEFGDEARKNIITKDEDVRG
jgi:hypothetical protein